MAFSEEGNSAVVGRGGDSPRVSSLHSQRFPATTADACAAKTLQRNLLSVGWEWDGLPDPHHASTSVAPSETCALCRLLCIHSRAFPYLSLLMLTLALRSAPLFRPFFHISRAISYSVSCFFAIIIPNTHIVTLSACVLFSFPPCSSP